MNLHLLPTPKSLRPLPGRLLLPRTIYLSLNSAITPTQARLFCRQAHQITRTPFRLATKTSTPTIRLTLSPHLFPKLPPAIRPQAYHLTISPTAITLAAPDSQGLFYALQTLLQILRSSPKNSLPCLEISDHPDFPRRGFYLDTARGKVPKLTTLLRLLDDLAALKYNEFQLYVENNFQFQRHPDLYNDTTPLTPQELQQLDAACRVRHIDFVPSLTSLGHFEKILSRPRYRPLAEAEPAQLKALNAPCWHDAGPWSLCVTDPRAKKLLADMYADFLPNFSSPTFNICCDEAYDLARVRSKPAAAKRGTGQLYLDWITFCARLARSHGKRIQLWADIILKYPDLIPQLPPDATLLEWGYEANHPFATECKTIATRLANSSRSFYVAPGTSSWLTFAGRSQNALANIHAAARAGLQHHARGLLLTDWGDHGHQQFLPLSYLPMAYAASAAWNLKTTPAPIQNRKSKIENRKFNSLLSTISLQFLADPSARLAPFLYDLGLTYSRLLWLRKNASADFFLFREKWQTLDFLAKVPPIGLRQTLRATKRLQRSLPRLSSHRPDGALLLRELDLTCRQIIHTCRRTLARQAWHSGKLPKNWPHLLRTLRHDARLLARDFKKLWLARNKPSRLADILAEFHRLDQEYTHFADPHPVENPPPPP